MKTTRIVLLLGLSACVLFSTEMPENMLRFDGKNLSGWKTVGTGRFTLEGGMLRVEGGPALLYYSFPQYPGPGHVRVEFKLTGINDKAGVVIKMPKEPPRSSIDARGGIKVWIASGDDKWHCTGAIEGLSPASACLQKPIGEWNTLDVWMGGSIGVFLNGAEVNEAIGDETGRFHGVENDSEDSTVLIRAISFSPNFN